MASNFDPLAALGSIGSSFVNAFSQHSANETNLAIARETNAHNRQLAEMQNQWNIEQWNRENAYNTPQAQMARLKAAGLNPNLVYGSLNGAANVSAQSPAMVASKDIAPLVHPEFNLDPVALSQASLNRSLANKADQEAKTEGEKRPYTIEEMKSQIASINQGIAESKSRYNLNSVLSKKADSEAREHFEQFRFLQKSLQERLTIIQNEAVKSGIDAAKSSVEFNYLEDTLKQTLANLRSTASLIKAETEQKQQLASFYRERAKYESTYATARLTDVHSRMYNDFLANYTRIEELNAQVERWDAMTVNERLGLADQILRDGDMIYGNHMTTETVEKESGGGKPSSQKTTYKRKRPQAKNYLPKRVPVLK